MAASAILSNHSKRLGSIGLRVIYFCFFARSPRTNSHKPTPTTTTTTEDGRRGCSHSKVVVATRSRPPGRLPASSLPSKRQSTVFLAWRKGIRQEIGQPQYEHWSLECQPLPDSALGCNLCRGYPERRKEIARRRTTEHPFDGLWWWGHMGAPICQLHALLEDSDQKFFEPWPNSQSLQYRCPKWCPSTAGILRLRRMQRLHYSVLQSSPPRKVCPLSLLRHTKFFSPWCQGLDA